MLCAGFVANEATSSDVGGWLKRQLLFSSALPSWQQLWSGGCGPPAGEYRTIWSSCAYGQIFEASLSVACVGFPLCSRDWFQNSSSKTLRPFIVFFGSKMENLMEMFYFMLRSQKRFHSLALALFVCLLSRCENRWFMYSLRTRVYV